MNKMIKVIMGTLMLSMGGFTGCASTPPPLVTTTSDDEPGVVQEAVSEHAASIRDWIKEL